VILEKLEKPLSRSELGKRTVFTRMYCHAHGIVQKWTLHNQPPGQINLKCENLQRPNKLSGPTNANQMPKTGGGAVISFHSPPRGFLQRDVVIFEKPIFLIVGISTSFSAQHSVVTDKQEVADFRRFESIGRAVVPLSSLRAGRIPPFHSDQFRSHIGGFFVL